MRKTKFGTFLGVVIAIGLLAACGGDGDSDTAQIKNADLKVGDEAPDFRLPDHKGGFVRLSDFKGKSNVVIAFYPAAFTPV